MIIVVKSGITRDEFERVRRTADDLGIASQSLESPEGRAVRLTVITGPCAVESEERLTPLARATAGFTRTGS
jgi:3-deoxy-D-arabino-heptulosonate 7-phosphate (DAHP) synthase